MPAAKSAAKPAVEYEKPSKQTTEDFWNAFEHRVHGAGDGRQAKKPVKDAKRDRWGDIAPVSWGQEAKAAPSYKPWQPPSQSKGDQFSVDPAKEPVKGRRSRFEDDEEEPIDDFRDRKGRKGRNEPRGRNRMLDDMEDDAELWDRRESRRAEKEARKAAQAKEEAEEAARPIFLPEFINVANLSRAVQQKTASFLSDLEEMGFENITEDTIMTGETAALIAMEYGFEPTVDDGAARDLRPRPPPEDVSVLANRPPVVTIMGHVDHGKTTLLDYLRKSSVAAQEHGGITQHIGAFVVQMSSGKTITFLDTPGHAAFLSMRQRGANVTDIVVLVVAADDSVKPQTLEALKHATAAKVPIIVAINKVDKEDARVDQVKADLSRHGVEIEDYGGDVQVVCVSGKTGQGMNDLEENIVTLSEILDVRAETDGMAEGWILESSVKQIGKTATVLVKRGTLRPGDLIVAGTTFCRIRMMRNEAGVELEEAPPGTPAEITGWRDLPEAGQQILQAPDESKARMAVEYRQDMIDREESSKQLAEQEQRQREEQAAAELAELEGEDNADEPEKEKESGMLLQNFVVKADVAGSVEAVVGSIMEQGNNEVRGRILRSSAGQITESDVDHATDTKSIIVNFNNSIMPHIKDRANQAKVAIIDQSVIYHLMDDVRNALSELLPPLISHRVTGEADVAQTFDINVTRRIYRKIAGCKVRNGSIKRSSLVKILRGGKVIYDGKPLSHPVHP
jgi:translation initiation factor IF-2